MARQRRPLRTPPPIDPIKMRAWRAVRTFEAMIPQLNSYVRSVTGNPTLKVQATAGPPRTDGKVIYMKPPARLGDNIEHDRSLCNRRDPVTLRHRCPACDVSDMIDAALYHELAHITFGTLEEPTSAGLIPLRALVDEWHPAEACDHAQEIRKTVQDMLRDHKESYVIHANLFNPILGILLNAFEDARVNVAQFDYRPGTRASLAAHAQSVMTDASEDDADWVPWHERDVNSQILIGMFFVASEEFGYVDMLCEEARQVIWANDMDSALTAVGRAGTVHDTVQVTVDIFRALQAMEVMVIPKCEVSQPEPEQEPEEGDDASSDGDETKPDGDDSGRQQDPGSAQKESQEEYNSPEDQGEDNPERGEQDASGGPGSGGDTPASTGARQPPDSSEDEDSSSDLGGREDQENGPAEGSGSRSPDEDRRGDEGASGDADSAPTDGRPSEDSPTECGDIQRPTSGDEDSDGDDGSSVGADVTDETTVGEDDAGSDVEPESAVEPVPSSSELDEASLEAIQATARRMSFHALFEEEMPDNNTHDFACGESELHPLSGEEDDGEEGFSWGETDDDQLIEALAIAIAQSMWFESPSAEVRGIEEYVYPDPQMNWGNGYYLMDGRLAPSLYMPDESIIGAVTTVTRIAFDENKRTKRERNLKRGRLNTKVLGRRAPLGDERLFQKRTIPGKRDHVVIITADCSFSTNTTARNANDKFTKNRYNSWVSETKLDRVKRAVFAQTEVLARLGIPFEVWAHTAEMDDDESNTSYVQMYRIKDKDTPWTEETKKALACVPPTSGNLDGHTLEFARKRAELYNVTDRHVIYYTDGAMPAMNYDEEGDILLRETEYCRKKNIHLLAVAIQSNSPEEWGFDTVRVDNDEDLIKVVEQIQRTVTR